MCKFTNCTHTNEPGCKILEAIKQGKLSEERYNQYEKLKNEIKYNANSDDYLKEKKEKFKAIAKINRKHWLIIAEKIFEVNNFIYMKIRKDSDNLWIN